MSAQQSNRGIAFAITGASLLVFGPLAGFFGTVFGMMRAFDTLGGNGISDPQHLSANINEVLVATAIGVGLAFVGLVLACIALFFSRYRAPWFFWFIVMYGGLLLFRFPIGTALGAIILCFSYVYRQEFLRTVQTPAED